MENRTLTNNRGRFRGAGHIYLHCDPTAEHYLRLMLDAVFGAGNFRNDVIWKRTSAHSSAKKYGPVHDCILFYSKSEQYTWNRLRQPYDQEYIEAFFTHTDPDGRRWRRADLTGAGVRKGNSGKPWRGVDVTAKGRHWAFVSEELDRMDAEGRIHWPAKKDGVPQRKRYLDDLPGMPVQDIIDDIKPIHNISDERLGYPTQKPVALLERLIAASTNKGDIVLDPFCGCGTTIHAAHKLGRQWLGIDVTHLAIQIIEDRINKHFPTLKFDVVGRPEDPAAACELASRDKYQFQFWAVSAIGGQPRDGERKGKDAGVDGVIYFKTGTKRDGMAVVSVKGGAHANPAMIRELHGTIGQEGADAGIFVCLEPPTRDMKTAAASAGFADLEGRKVAKIQIVTVDDLFSNGRIVDLPPTYTTSTVLEAARRATPKTPKKIKPEELRKSPPMKLPLAGGKSATKRGQYLIELQELPIAAEAASNYKPQRRSKKR